MAYNLPMADNGEARRRTGRRGLWIAAVGAVCAVVGIWHLPDRMYPGGEVEMGQARAALQGGLLTAAAALTAVAGGLIALDETRRANRDTHVRELYVEAVKLLNDAELGIRLAGIYALERIARDSIADQRTVVEVLAAFVRQRTHHQATPTPSLRRPPPGRRWTQPSPGTGDDAPMRLTIDIQAALTVLGRLPRRRGVSRADLSGLSLINAELVKADLAGAQLAEVNLTDARLSKANLTGAYLPGANLARAWLFNADLSSAHLVDATFADAKLDLADLTGAWLFGANLTGAWLRGTNLAGAVGLSQEQVDAARGDGRTRLPAGLTHPASWRPEEPPDES
ncbi:conserved hypothetical protein [Frankia sp. Hr75.2]|nr:conserved hypothetical protein [Frankia sp. Hr75.2]